MRGYGARPFFRRHAARVWKFTKHPGYHVLVFFHFERAGGINQAPARRKLLQRGSQQRGLQMIEFAQLFGPQPPADFWMPRERSSSRAWRIYQNAVKLDGKGKRLRRVQLDESCFAQIEPLELFAHCSQPVRVTIRGDHQPILSGVARECWRLSSRRGTQIKSSIA